MRNSGSKLVTGLAVTAAALALGAFAWSVAGMSLDVGLGQRIASAREKWDAQDIKSYRVVVRFINYNQPRMGDITVVVRDGALVEATSPSQSGQVVDIPAEEASFYTIEALFDYAAQQVKDVPGVYIATGDGYHFEVSIDDTLSYITEFKMDICGRGPLAISAEDCRWGFDVLDVRPGE